MTEDQPIAHPLPAKVEIPIAQAKLLAGLSPGLLDLEGRSFGIRDEGRLRDPHLVLAGGKGRVDGFGLAAHDLAGGAQNVFGAQTVPQLESSAGDVGIEDELHEAGSVAKIHEHEPAVIAPTMYPSRHPHGLVDALLQHLTAPGIAIAVGPNGGEDRNRLSHG